ncbi:MAG: hypothetical protein ACI4VK_00425 [Candidatus Coproplasma sp.]
MKKADSGEFYNINQYNDFSEYQPFSAEIYYSQESQKPPVENQSFNESFEDDGGKPTGGSEESSTDLDDIQKEYDKINQAENSGSADSSATSSPSQTATSTSSGGATSSSGGAAQAGSAVGGSAAGAAGASAGATAVAAVVIVSAVVTGGFLTDVGKHVEYNTGMDYVAITVDMDEILSETDKSYSLSADNFYLQFDKDGKPLTVPLTNGKHSYLVTGLQPEKSYTYSLMCSNPPLGSNSSCFSQTVTTSGSGEPSAVWDELNNYVSLDQTTQTASVYYSVYLSDYAKALSGATLYLCSSEQTDFSHVTQVVYSSEELDENNFFKGSADGITYEQLYLYVVAQPSAGAEATCLLSHKIEVGLPEEWVKDATPAFVVDEGAEEVTCQPDSITVSGKITNLNADYTYFAYITQYNSGGTALVERQEAGLITDPENMTYSVNAEAYYGVKTFKYVIYTYDEDENEVVVYDSGEKQFTASQAFGATYSVVQPKDATIEYGASNVTITVDPQFTSDYGNYEYKLVVTNSAGEVYGQYQGTGEAVIEIADYVGLDQINFTYYDIGTFVDGEVELGNHTTTPVTGRAYFVADESAEDITCQPDSITVSGKITNLNNNYSYFAYVTQYNEDGTATEDAQEAAFSIDFETMIYTVESGAYYGVNTYKYVICTYDEDENEVVVYDSGERQFTASQAFGATYTKVEPTDATIEYGASSVTITVDPQFTSDYGNYEYKLVVTNSAGEVYGQYQGTGEAVIEIADYVGLDQINFTYYDIGTFADGEVELGNHTTTGVGFCVPTLSLGSEYGFDGQYFTLSYVCDMVYDYAQASMDIEVTDGDGTGYTKHIASVAESGTVTLDFVTGEPGSATIKVTLNFTDNQSDGAERSLTVAQADYTMNYAFEVTKVVADVSGYSAETLQVELNFDYQLPTGYLIKIADETNAIDLTLDLTKQYSINGLAMDADYNLTVQVTDADGNNWGEAKAVTISKSAAEAEYTDELSIDHPSPIAAVVTYNDDGTINIYREMIPSVYGRDTISDDERIYYNAVVCSGYNDEEYNFIETDRYDVIGRGRFAIIENIPLQNYLFTYYHMFDYNGVSYIMNAETPSGMVECVYSDSDGDGYEDFASADVLCADGQTTISVNVWSSGNLDNKITVNGTEYTYTTYTDEYETAPTLVIDGEIEVSEVTIYFTKQGYNYDTFAEYSDLTMKGSKFVGHVVLVTPTEA